MTSPLIIALDFDNKRDALNFAGQLDPQLCSLKIGNELFTHYGPELIKQLITQGYRIFLDLKFHDIPNTVQNACKAAADLGIWMLNVHAMGGVKMMEAARTILESYGAQRPLIIAVTLLTSFDQTSLTSLGIELPLNQQIQKLAVLAKNSGLDGVVCSAWEAQDIKRECNPDFLTVTPGIRLTPNNQDDQVRIMSPTDALKNGSDYLVIGRPITQADDPIQVVKNILYSVSML